MIDTPDDTWRWETRIRAVVFQGFRFHIATSHHPDGRIVELAYSGPHNGSALHQIVEDACILINELINRFVAIDRLSELVRRKADGNAESIIGEIILQLAQAP